MANDPTKSKFSSVSSSAISLVSRVPSNFSAFVFAIFTRYFDFPKMRNIINHTNNYAIIVLPVTRNQIASSFGYRFAVSNSDTY